MLDILLFHGCSCLFRELMGTELVRACVKEENMEIPAIPPGFESLTPFSLKKVEGKAMKTNYSTPVTCSGMRTTQTVTESQCNADSKILKSLRRRHCINYGQPDNSSGDESDSEQVFLLVF